ncbi:MAG: tyrosine-type recombinase/integrase [Limisphaerales bacterium]
MKTKPDRYLIKRGNNYYCSWRHDGKLLTRALRDASGQPITTLEEARKARDEFMRPFSASTETKVLEELNAKIQGRKAELAKWEDEKNPALTIAKAWSEFLASANRPDSGDSTLRQYGFQWQAFADWMKEKYPERLTLRDVTKEFAEEYASNLSHGNKLTPSTYNKHLNLLALIFRIVKDKAKLTNNVWESPKRGGHLQRKRMITNSRRELTFDELRNTCQVATGELRILLALGVYSGLRLGDCATLRWAETDLKRGLIRRVPNKTARRNPKPVIVPIHPVLREMLSEIPSNQRKEYVLPEMASLYARNICAVTDKVQNHFKACGITLHKPGTGAGGKRAVIEVGFHSLRHTFVSLCRESNAPLAVVESIVGHSNPAMTRHYTHVGELAAGRAVALLPSVMSEATPEPPKLEPSRILREVQNLAKSITAKNWRKQKSALLVTLASGNF